jgi:hypothetical protein
MRMTRSSYLALVLACVLAHPGARAESTVYKCVDKSGHVEFTDINKPGCKALDLPGYMPAPRAPTPSPSPAANPAPSMRQGARPAASPSSFPRVDSATQRARDDDRRAILDEELRAEEQKLAALRRDFNNGEPERQGNEKNYAKYQERVAQMREDISRSEKNVEALRREIANIR